MTVHKNIILQYSATTFVIVIAISTALGITFTRRLENYQISSHRSIITSQRGTHFDPVLVDVFVRREQDFRRISEELAD